MLQNTNIFRKLKSIRFSYVIIRILHPITYFCLTFTKSIIIHNYTLHSKLVGLLKIF